MPMNEKQKRKFLAVVRQLKKQKNFTVKQAEIAKDIKNLEKAQAEINKVAQEHKEEAAVQKAAEAENQKLQNIINDLNEYMKVLHPEGLLDYGSGANGQQVVGQG